MIKNYFKIAFRSLWRHRAFSLINILGLAVGMTACFLIYMYVSFEKSYDSFNTKADRIFRVVTEFKTPSDEVHVAVTTPAVAFNLKNDFPEVESFVRFNTDGYLVRKGNFKYQEKESMLADSTVFSVFDFPLIYGDKKTALKEPMSIVLSQTAAKKYFGDTNPVGQQVLLTGAGINARVTGVMKDIPENSHLKADMFVSMTSYQPIYQYINPDSNWNVNNTYTYILLRPNADYHALESKLTSFVELHLGSQQKRDQSKLILHLEPLRGIYLHSSYRHWGGIEAGNVSNVNIFSVVAVFILLIACINFINLTTARSAERAKEVGVRKVIGAERMQLTTQFIGESIIISLFAFVLAVLLCALLMPLFNQLAGKTISADIFSKPVNIVSLFILAVAIGVVAGIYPSLVLSSFKPVNVLKGRFSSGTQGLLLRKGLVVFQFAISIMLIIGTIVVYTQLGFMRNQDLGFSKEQTMVVNTNYDKNKDAFKQSLSAIAGVLSSAYSSAVPGTNIPAAHSQIENKAGQMQVANIDVYFVDFDFIKQYGMHIVAGRSFSREFATDTANKMVVNESVVRLLGYSSPEQAIGKKFEQWGRKGEIIGVVKNFHYKSLQEEIKPLTMRIEPTGFGMLSIKLSTTNLSSTIKEIGKKWEQAIPHRPFDYSFLDESFDQQYRAEDRFGNLFFNFAVLAIFISCLGLLGLASYSTIQRTKEIGVRKVLGASVSNIVNLLSLEFIKLVVVAFVIAVPVAWFGMHKWLMDFAYRTNINWWVFVLAGVAATFIAFITISFQAIKAAVANPVKSLRSE
ncbi:MAG: ABC transporter permease [Bacteroidetes bacterium]|nr:ABC transporter permease [Bacteroidota bacterium]